MHDGDIKARQPFWKRLETYGEAPALILANDGRQLSYAALAALADRIGARLASRDGGLIVLAVRNDVGGVAALLAAMRARRPALLVAAESGDLQQLVNTYRPGAIIAPASSDHGVSRIIERTGLEEGYQLLELADPAPVHPDLCAMILTSGSLGSPRAVRLSWQNMAASAGQIQSALHLTADDRAPLHLPLHYVYGLSVLCSHLDAGGAVLVQTPSLLDRQFWTAAAEQALTSLPGVSFTFEILRGLGARWRPPPSLHRLTHSGDRLSEASISWALNLEPQLGFYRMYGMSEAGSRIAVLPRAEFQHCPQSVGRAVLGGRLSISEDGEIIYSGPNVMLGYADAADDLGRGDDLAGILRTQDLGSLDHEGRLQIHGRVSRLAKIMGVRVSLDDVEGALETIGPVVAQATEGGLLIVHEPIGDDELASAIGNLARRLRVPPNAIASRRVDKLMRNAAGKILKRQPGCD